MNVRRMLQMQRLLSQVRKNHPKFEPFVRAVSHHAIQEGTLVDITVTEPSGKSYRTNLKLTAADLEVIKEVKQSRGKE